MTTETYVIEHTAPETRTPVQRILGVLFSPVETFDQIRQRADVLLPLLILLVMSVVSGAMIAQRVDFHAAAQEAMDANPRAAEMSADQLASMSKFTAKALQISAYGAPVLFTLTLVVVAAALLLAFRLMGGQGDFKRAFSIATYAAYPRLIKTILALGVLWTRSSISMWDLTNPLASNLGFLFDPKTQPLSYGFVSAFDIFSFWNLALLAIGFAAMSRLSIRRSSFIVVSLWIFANVLTLIGPAMQAISAAK